MSLRHNPDHIVNTLLAENQVSLGEKFTGFPDHMVTSIPWEKIKKQFFFAKAPTDYKSNLCSKMLNAYFHRDVYKCNYPKKSKKRSLFEDSDDELTSKPRKCVKQADGKRNYSYKTDEKWAALVAEVTPVLSNFTPLDLNRVED
ncbi:hypothetical protein HDU89_008928 [Geranomyces variabilis]|nr:hypothetical protein HDU89_008928 [Geranomyces variabilis]